MSDDSKTLSPGEALKEDLDSKNRHMRAAIRWLSEARRFRSDFGGEHWKEGAEGELATVANKAYNEAVIDVVMARRNLEKVRAEFKRMSKK